MANCVFCQIIAQDLPTDFVYENEKMVVFRDIHPKAEVHLLIVPREHIASLIDAKVQHGPLIAEMLLLLPKLAKEQGLERGFRTVINTGPGGGQIIDHIHFHLLGAKHSGYLPKF